MHIEFKNVVLHNFMSFGHSELNFDDSGFVRVSGINNNPLDNAVSNGSGKSSLWESIIWALTGDTSRGTKHVVNLFGEDGCYVELDFTIDNKSYKIIRSKDHKVFKTNLQIFINGQDCSGKGIRDSEKLLSQYLPDITASLISSVIILGQGLPQKFTNNTPSGRKEVLEKLSKSDFMIEDLKKRVADRKVQLQTQLREHEDNLLQNTSHKNYLVQQITEQEKLLSTLDRTTLQQKKESLEQEHQSLVQEMSIIDEEIEQHQIIFNDSHNKKQQIIFNKNSALESIKNHYEETVTPLKQKKMNLTADLKATKKHLSEIENIKEVCPTCGQKLVGVVKPDTSAIKVSIELMESELQDVESQLAAKDVDFRHEMSSMCSTYDSQELEVDAIITKHYNQLDPLRKTKTEAQNKEKIVSTNLNNVELKLMQLDTIINNCNKVIRENNEKITIIEDKILYNNEQKDLTQSHLEVISKFGTALNRDFRGYLLSTVISYIESRAKQYSNIIFDTDKITFSLDGNNIDISYMNKSYENLSGGEKQKIDLIIQFSIRDMLSAQLGFTSNILVLDEVFDSLDLQGCNRVIDMIATLSDVRNIFIVTHRKDLSIPTDKDLIVFKSSVGISEIQR